MTQRELESIRRAVREEIVALEEAVARWRVFHGLGRDGGGDETGFPVYRGWRQDMDVRLAELRAVLARMEGDEFGVCDDCGEDIAPQRLLAVPTTRRCIGCARGREAAGRPGTTPRPTPGR